MGSFVRSTIMHTRATQHFHHGLLLSTPKEKKRISKKHTKIFLEFLFFYGRRTRTRKTIYTGKLPTSKRRTRNLFGFSLILLLNEHGKETKQKLQLIFFCSKFFKHTRRKREKENKLTWILQ